MKTKTQITYAPSNEISKDFISGIRSYWLRSNGNTHQIHAFEKVNRTAKSQVTQKLHIKNMVSLSCMIAVQDAMDKLDLQYTNVELGEVDLVGNITPEQQQLLKAELSKFGLDLLQDKKSVLIEKVKNLICKMVHYADNLPETKFSVYISEKLNYDYTYLANIFSKITGITIEHYIINHKIERVKELILEDELSITEIAYTLNYSSVAHLSNQFKKYTGITPTHFKQIRQYKNRIPLEIV